MHTVMWTLVIGLACGAAVATTAGQGAASPPDLSPKNIAHDAGDNSSTVQWSECNLGAHAEDDRAYRAFQSSAKMPQWVHRADESEYWISEGVLEDNVQGHNGRSEVWRAIAIEKRGKSGNVHWRTIVPRYLPKTDVAGVRAQPSASTIVVCGDDESSKVCAIVNMQRGSAIMVCDPTDGRCIRQIDIEDRVFGAFSVPGRTEIALLVVRHLRNEDRVGVIVLDVESEQVCVDQWSDGEREDLRVIVGARRYVVPFGANVRIESRDGGDNEPQGGVFVAELNDDELVRISVDWPDEPEAPFVTSLSVTSVTRE